MTSSADTSVPAMLDDFVAFTLAGAQPGDDARAGVCANGAQWSWIDDGVLQFEPAASSGGDVRSVLASAGIHGDETAPIELLSFLVRDIAHGRVALECRVLVILGNVQAMRESCRYIDDDLNRLFSGRHAQLPESHEAPRAAALERIATRFFADASDAPGARWHIDMHTAIRASVFEQFALLPHTGAPLSRSMFEWLRDARIAAVLLHTTKGNTYSHFTAEFCGADACTLELGKVRPFGQNDLSRFVGADHAVRQLIAGEAGNASLALPRVFTVIDQITKKSDAFELLFAKDVANFTAFGRDTVLARDGDYRYVVRHDEERIVFPNATVKPGLRAGLLVVETTDETHSVLV
ncbi:succinylglutamate desuccinylase [Paraburkholderia diazotrophica]|uniref:succinylglutamate desuccinylase n=1 Tax=Paraburkholderia diazotrophica TaxID=667676 RepID=UPI003172C96F